MKTKTFIMLAAVIAVVASGCKKGSEPNYSDDTTPGIVEEYVTDCQGKKYKAVKIRNSVWMAENLDCLVYDSESEYSGTLSYVDNVKEFNTFTPYCVNAADRTKWDDDKDDYYAENVTDEMVKNFGTMYNWAAAVGMDKEKQIKGTIDFSGYRQGICPNGWHLPTKKEIEQLKESAKGSSFASNMLRSKSGWHNNDNGTDDFGFNMFPAGACTLGSMEVYKVGLEAMFWASGPAYDDDPTYMLHLEMNSENNIVDCFMLKSQAASVRCVKN